MGGLFVCLPGILLNRVLFDWILIVCAALALLTEMQKAFELQEAT